jgi:hypothetical protein
VNTQILIALIGMVAAFGGIATGIVALRKVGTENSVAIRTVAVSEADLTIESQSKFIDSLREDNTGLRAEIRELRAEIAVLTKRLREGGL